jgi:hypothetical protein
VEAVDGIEIMWMKDGQLQPGRPGCTTIAAVPGQTTFTCETDFLTEHSGVQTFHAFMKAKLFGIPLPGLIEISKSGKAQVGVATGTPHVRAGRRVYLVDGSFFVFVPETGLGQVNPQEVRVTLPAGGTVADNFNEALSDSYTVNRPGGGSATANYASTLLVSMTGTPDAVWGLSASGSRSSAGTWTTSEARESFSLHAGSGGGGPYVSMIFDVVGGPIQYNINAQTGSSVVTNAWSIGYVRLVQSFSASEETRLAEAGSCSLNDSLWQLLTGSPPSSCDDTWPLISPSFAMTGTLQPGTYSLYATATSDLALNNIFEWFDAGITSANSDGQASFSFQIDFSPAP